MHCHEGRNFERIEALEVPDSGSAGGVWLNEEETSVVVMEWSQLWAPLPACLARERFSRQIDQNGTRSWVRCPPRARPRQPLSLPP